MIHVSRMIRVIRMIRMISMIRMVCLIRMIRKWCGWYIVWWMRNTTMWVKNIIYVHGVACGVRGMYVSPTEVVI